MPPCSYSGRRVEPGCTPGRSGLVSPGPGARGADRGRSESSAQPGSPAGGRGAEPDGEEQRPGALPSQRASSVRRPRGEKAKRAVQARFLPVPAV